MVKCRYERRSYRNKSRKNERNAVLHGYTSSRLFDYLEAGDSVGEFLNDFPTVTHERVLGVLELMRTRILTEYETAA